MYRITSKLVIGDAEFAQLLAVAEKCPLHKRRTIVTTEITARIAWSARPRPCYLLQF